MYTWQVWQNNRFVGYVLACSEYEALVKAKDKYGDNLYVERTWLEKNVLG
jgi:hypothetical protein